MDLDGVARSSRMGRHDGSVALRQRLSNVDLPAFGGPAMATTKPSRRRSPRPDLASAPAISSRNSFATRSAGTTSSSGTSASSEKSIRASTSASADMIFSRHASARSPIRPLSCRNAWRRCAGVSAAIRSARPSMAVRSSRPLSKARRVNSPASAGRHPSMSFQRIEHRSDDGVTAVELQLRHVVAGFAVRTRKPQHQRLIDNFAARGIAHASERGLARFRNPTDELFQSEAGARSAQANHGDRRRRPAGGEGVNGGTIVCHVSSFQPLLPRNGGSSIAQAGDSAWIAGSVSLVARRAEVDMTASRQLLGTWKLISFQVATEDGDERHDVYDAHPRGSLLSPSGGSPRF